MLNKLFRRRTNGTEAAPARYEHGNDHLIELNTVIKSYETAAGDFFALKGVDLKVNPSEFVAVVGKSGSGKSTLINMITGIDRPTSGDVLIGDTAVHTLNEGQIAVWRGRNVGVVFQFFQLLPTLTVIENVMLPMDFCGTFPGRERRDRSMHLLAQVDMTEHADKLPTAISGGQQQRVAIARSLANDPPIIVADEPTGNLDSKTADSVFHLFEDLVASGKTILMVTHDEDLAQRVTRTVTIADGEIVQDEDNQRVPSSTQVDAPSSVPIVNSEVVAAPDAVPVDTPNGMPDANSEIMAAPLAAQDEMAVSASVANGEGAPIVDTQPVPIVAPNDTQTNTSGNVPVRGPANPLIGNRGGGQNNVGPIDPDFVLTEAPTPPSLDD